MIMMMMIFMQIKRQIGWWAACLRGGGMEDGNQERIFGVHLGSIVLLLVPLAPVSLALNHFMVKWHFRIIITKCQS